MNKTDKLEKETKELISLFAEISKGLLGNLKLLDKRVKELEKRKNDKETPNR